jgi:hypothetical protein
MTFIQRGDSGWSSPWLEQREPNEGGAARWSCPGAPGGEGSISEELNALVGSGIPKCPTGFSQILHVFFSSVCFVQYKAFNCVSVSWNVFAVWLNHPRGFQFKLPNPCHKSGVNHPFQTHSYGPYHVLYPIGLSYSQELCMHPSLSQCGWLDPLIFSKIGVTSIG